MTGRELLKLAIPHQGEKYVLGTIVPKNMVDYDGPWDCAEFASWLVYQLTVRLYGCANNSGDPDGADAYSGFWGRDVNKLGQKISVDQAAKIPGAVVLRLAGNGLIGHVVISDGAGGTIEAHSTKTGVIASTMHGRRWDCGVLVPWITYEPLDTQHPPLKKPGMIYRYMAPMMQGDKVKEIQRALGFVGKNVDGFYGPKTYNAVKDFQRNQSLVADGEVGQQTATKLGIMI
jgi:murein L,D-transpeptidase YcbB/YkuD